MMAITFKNLIMAYQKLQAYRAADVTPSDTVDIPAVSTAGGEGNNGCVLYCGVAGNIRVLTVGNDDVTLVGDTEYIGSAYLWATGDNMYSLS